MKIKVFHHSLVWFDGNYDILQEQFNLLESTGLLDVADEVNIMMHFKEIEFDWLKQKWNNRSNVKYHLFDEPYRQWCEASTILYIQNLCNSTSEEFFVLYITPKGVTHKSNIGSQEDVEQKNWRHYMNYWNIEMWRDCVMKLDEGYDTCGASFILNPGHYHSINGRTSNPIYAGNMFWARASYLRKCIKLKKPTEVGFSPQISACDHHRYDWEFWHGSGEPKAFDLHPGKNPGSQDLRWTLGSETYRLDRK